MAKYILKRILIALVVLWGITVIDFLIMSLIGNPIEIMSGGPKVNDAMLARRAQSMGLDKPVIVQYWNWLVAICHGDFGYSYKNYESVASQIRSHLGPTLVLTGSALLLSMVISIIGGVFSAVHQHKKSDYTIVTASFFGQSIPSFFLGLLLIYVFAVRLGVLPASGMRTLGAMLEILSKDYLRTAKGKGIGRQAVIWRHALRNALIPIITVIGMEIPGLFGGSIIIEQIFSWPGLGLLTMNAVLARDYPVIMAVALLSAVVVLTANLITDILYAVVDPTVRLG